ncbi:tubby-like F-box protein 8 [Artemisia annua]|uniref:Tubby-like F-box protein n=1 Tax=Artemisia annua TaxID=35608 RepID=A0A2U1LFR4_ARTAN|nr:tubby-like F-box protein 8 [Artemisia annua]
MSFRSIVRDLRDGIGSLSRRGFEVRIASLNRSKSQSVARELDDHDHEDLFINSHWDGLPLELLRDVIERLEASESTWPARKHVVACSAVCRSWREMCKEIVSSPESSGKLTFPISLKQPGPRDTTIQCFIKRDKASSKYYLYLCLSSALLVENGKFLLSAKRNRRSTCTEYVISMDAENISRSNSSYIGKVRSNFLGTKFIIYDSQPPHSSSVLPVRLGSSRRFSRKVSPKVPSGSFNIAQISYELNVLGTRGPRRMHCVMHSIPMSALEPGGTIIPDHPNLFPQSFEDSFRSISFSKSIDNTSEFGSSRFYDIMGPTQNGEQMKNAPLVLKNKQPRWHEQLQCWCLNFKGRVTVASVKNFQLIAAAAPQVAVDPSAPPQTAQAQPQSSHDKVILQFGKVGKDIFTMDYRYPLSAFQAFAICLSSFDTKLACE